MAADPMPIGAPYLNVKDFGAIGDGKSHRLDQFFSTVADARAVYPFLPANVDLTQVEIDWAAIQASLLRVGTAADPLGALVLIPHGHYLCSDNIFVCRQVTLQGTMPSTILEFASRKGLRAVTTADATLDPTNPAFPYNGDSTYAVITGLRIRGTLLDPPADVWSASASYQVGSLVRATHDNRYYFECTDRVRTTLPVIQTWTGNHPYNTGNIVTPRAGAIRFICERAIGATGSGEPNWNLSINGATLDGSVASPTVVWRRYTGPGAAAEWRGGYTYHVGDVVTPSQNFLEGALFQALSAGTSGESIDQAGKQTDPLWTAPFIDIELGLVADGAGGLTWARYPVFPMEPVGQSFTDFRGFVWTSRAAAGIEAHTKVRLSNLLIEGFPCAGVYVNSVPPVEKSQPEFCYLDNVLVFNCGVGFYLASGQVNYCTAVACFAASIGGSIPGYGGIAFCDRGIGNTWMTPSVEGSTGFPFAVTKASMMINTYAEETFQFSFFAGNAIILGNGVPYRSASDALAINYNTDWQAGGTDARISSFIVANVGPGGAITTALGGLHGSDVSAINWKWQKDGAFSDWSLIWDNDFLVWRMQERASYIGMFPAMYLTSIGSPVRSDAAATSDQFGMAGFPSLLLGSYFDVLTHKPASRPPTRLQINPDNNRPADNSGNVGDIALNPNPTTHVGWICVQGASPNTTTWKLFGQIEAG
jgi:hypothetical protein